MAGLGRSDTCIWDGKSPGASRVIGIQGRGSKKRDDGKTGEKVEMKIHQRFPSPGHRQAAGWASCGRRTSTLGASLGCHGWTDTENREWRKQPWGQGVRRGQEQATPTGHDGAASIVFAVTKERQSDRGQQVPGGRVPSQDSGFGKAERTWAVSVRPPQACWSLPPAGPAALRPHVSVPGTGLPPPPLSMFWDLSEHGRLHPHFQPQVPTTCPCFPTSLSRVLRTGPHFAPMCGLRRAPLGMGKARDTACGPVRQQEMVLASLPSRLTPGLLETQEKALEPHPPARTIFHQGMRSRRGGA